MEYSLIALLIIGRTLWQTCILIGSIDVTSDLSEDSDHCGWTDYFWYYKIVCWMMFFGVQGHQLVSAGVYCICQFHSRMLFAAVWNCLCVMLELYGNHNLWDSTWACTTFSPKLDLHGLTLVLFSDFSDFNNSLPELLCSDEDSGNEDVLDMEYTETEAEGLRRNAEVNCPLPLPVAPKCDLVYS